MWVSRLELTDYRNYAHALVQLDPGVSLLIGRNGQGKTNLVEAVAYCAMHASHRVAQDAALVRLGSTSAAIRAELVRGQRRARLDIAINPGRSNRAAINGSPVPRVRDSLGLVRAVVFAPEDLGLVRGDPGERRRFLDGLLVQRQPRFAAVRADLDRVLKQRNALLKGLITRRDPDPSAEATLDVWNAQLTSLGASLTAARMNLLADLLPRFQRSYAEISGGNEGVDASYASALGPLESAAAEAIEEAMRGELARRRTEELRRGVTLVGPHRDDVLLTLDRAPARSYASHGQSWSLALALRLASYDLLRTEALDDGEPILILDDVFAELDERRRSGLVAQALAAEQSLITVAVESDIPEGLTAARYEVAAGSISRKSTPSAGDVVLP